MLFGQWPLLPASAKGSQGNWTFLGVCLECALVPLPLLSMENAKMFPRMKIFLEERCYCMNLVPSL